MPVWTRQSRRQRSPEVSTRSGLTGPSDWLHGLKRTAWRSGLFVLLGAIVAGSFTTWATTIQVKAAKEQSQLEFVREQRIDTYAMFLDALNELSLKETAALDSMDMYLVDDTFEDEVKDKTSEADHYLDSMLALENRITIVGSKEVRSAAADIMDSHRSLVGKWEIIIESPTSAIQDAGISTHDSRLRMTITAIKAQESIQRLSRALSEDEIEATKNEYRQFTSIVRAELDIED